MKAIICGAGIAGLTLAWWLEHDGWQVELVERAPGPREEDYMVDLFGSGFDVAEVMGLAPQLSRAHAGIGELAYVNQDERDEGHLGYSRLAQVFGGRMVSLMRGDLEWILLAAVADRASIRYSMSVDAVEEEANRVKVTLSDGSVARADLLIGADGMRSRVRELVFGPDEQFVRYLGYHTASYLLKDDDIRTRVGDRFLVVGAPGRQAGFYPTGDGQLAMTFIHATPDPSLPADTHRTVRTVHGQLGGLVRRALRHCPDEPELFYDQVAQVEMDSWSRGPVILVGDACQAVSAMAGEGASIAMAGAYVLADELRRGPVSEAAARYEERLWGRIRDKQKAARSSARWMVPEKQWRSTIRGAALAAARMPGGTRLLRTWLGATGASLVGVDIEHRRLVPARAGSA